MMMHIRRRTKRITEALLQYLPISINTGSGDVTSTGTPKAGGRGARIGEGIEEEAMKIMMHIRRHAKRVTLTRVSILTEIHEHRVR